MYYEDEPRSKRRPKRRRGFLGSLITFLLKTIFKLILLIAAVGIILYALPVSLFITDSTGELSASDTLETDTINILLLGIDRTDNATGKQRADTIMIMSVGYNRMTLTSVLRDTTVDIPGYGRHKLNAAYAYGGAELTMRTLNENFGLNITRYVVVDFFAVADIINAIGGIDVQITYGEQEELNRILKENWVRDFSKRGYDVSETSLLALDFSNADAEGKVNVHLDGFQALAYARIRKVGNSDYERALRQRRVISLTISEFKSSWYDPVMLYSLAGAAYRNIDTNMTVIELISIGSKAAFADEIPQLRIPASGTYTDDGSALTDIDYAENLRIFTDFAYPK